MLILVLFCVLMILQWPTVKLVLDRLKDEGAEKTYQGVVLKSYNQQTVDYCAKEAIAGLNKLNDEMKERLEWSNVEVLILTEEKICSTLPLENGKLKTNSHKSEVFGHKLASGQT